MIDAKASRDARPGVVELYSRMCVIRAFEQRVGVLYRASEIPGFIHTSLGQEAVAVGVCAALTRDDTITTTHRGHGHCLAKGADVDAAMAELFGKSDGLCKGKGGSMHIADPRVGVLGANAIVGASLPLATGAALSSKLLGGGSVAVAFFGEGAVNQGAFHESLNLAAIWSLPALFVCENNTYAEFTDSRTMSRRPGVAQLGPTYGLLSRQVDGNDVEAVLAAASEACSACRAGQGPFLLEALTYRWQGHYEGDQQAYKPDAEAEAWKARDPLQITRRRVEDAGVASRDELDEIMAAAERRIDEALAFARASAFPPIDETYTDVFCD
jgi:TPP-dependent pyruvate/acetoin dehydrogenase alpha subunit